LVPSNVHEPAQNSNTSLKNVQTYVNSSRADHYNSMSIWPPSGILWWNEKKYIVN